MAHPPAKAKKGANTQLPESPWPKDPKLKEIGRYNQVNILEALDAYSYALLTRAMGWPKSQVEVFLAGVRSEVKDLSNHIYTNIRVVYGQKPE